jgi:hypothetical protein
MAKCATCAKDIGNNQTFKYYPKGTTRPVYFCGDGKGCMSKYVSGGKNDK